MSVKLLIGGIKTPHKVRLAICAACSEITQPISEITAIWCKKEPQAVEHNEKWMIVGSNNLKGCFVF